MRVGGGCRSESETKACFAYVLNLELYCDLGCAIATRLTRFQFISLSPCASDFRPPLFTPPNPCSTSVLLLDLLPSHSLSLNSFVSTQRFD